MTNVGDFDDCEEIDCNDESGKKVQSFIKNLLVAFAAPITKSKTESKNQMYHKLYVLLAPIIYIHQPHIQFNVDGISK